MRHFRKLALLACLCLVSCSESEAWMNTTILGSRVPSIGCTGANPIVATGPPVTYDCTGFAVCQNFETAVTGYDNTNAAPEVWTEAGDPEAAYTTAPLRDAQSWYGIDPASTDDTAYTALADPTEIYYFLRLKVSGTGDQSAIVKLRHSTTTYSSLDVLDGVLKVTQGSAHCDGTTALVAATKYYIWGYWKTESAPDALDGISTIWLSQTPTFPGALSYECTTGATGSSDGHLDRFYLGALVNIGNTIDQVLVKTTEIGTVCE